MNEKFQLAKPYLVVLALHELGGEADLEAITVKAFELFPDEFSWHRYPEYPDKDTVRVHLSDAKKEAFGHLVEDRDLRQVGSPGSRVKRYALTRAGVEKAREIRQEFELDEVGGSAKSIDYRRVVEPILSSDAFQQFRADGSFSEVSRESFLAAFKLFSDTSPVLIRGRLARVGEKLTNLRESQEQQLLLDFLRDGREHFDV